MEFRKKRKIPPQFLVQSSEQNFAQSSFCVVKGAIPTPHLASHPDLQISTVPPVHPRMYWPAAIRLAFSYSFVSVQNVNRIETVIINRKIILFSCIASLELTEVTDCQQNKSFTRSADALEKVSQELRPSENNVSPISFKWKESAFRI